MCRCKITISSRSRCFSRIKLKWYSSTRWCFKTTLHSMKTTSRFKCNCKFLQTQLIKCRCPRKKYFLKRTWKIWSMISNKKLILVSSSKLIWKSQIFHPKLRLQVVVLQIRIATVKAWSMQDLKIPESLNLRMIKISIYLKLKCLWWCQSLWSKKCLMKILQQLKVDSWIDFNRMPTTSFLRND